MKESGILLRIYDLLLVRYGPQGWWPGDTRFEISVGAILTQNTNWGNVEKAIANLKKAQLLLPKAMHLAGEHKLAELIRPSGYFNVKTGRLRSFTSYITTEYNGSMQRMASVATERLRHELLNVKGIGPETADSILLYAFNRPVFVIDAYTKRVMSRHGILHQKVSYSEYQALFHDQLPCDAGLFNEFHALIVRLGKEHCRPSPLCHKCPLISISLPKAGLCSARL